VVGGGLLGLGAISGGSTAKVARVAATVPG
jgi:hypothetical protein